MTIVNDTLRAQYKDLQDHIALEEKGEIKPQDLKGKSSLLGIYKERDGKFMCRIRRNGAETSVNELRIIGDAIITYDVHHVHWSTRQNGQLHGVPGENVEKLILELGEQGIVFRGGGGNTFRSISSSPYAGVSNTETFDVNPYIEKIWEYIFNYEKAYLFKRKFKLSLSSELFDNTNAGINDLGFIATIKDGERGFKVYGGGGMGRGGCLGILLQEFIPTKDLLRASIAMIDIFYDHGDKENRSKARLRFVKERLGDDAFRELYLEYFNKVDVPDITDVVDRDLCSEVEKLKIFEGSETSKAFELWKKRTVTATKFSGVVSVNLFIAGGNFTGEELKVLADVLDDVGAPFIRTTLNQDVVIPLVHESALYTLYKLLEEKLPNQDATSDSFKDHIVTCIGAARCPIGLLKSPEAADKIAEGLNSYFEDKSDLKTALFNTIIDSINVSGCGSGCGLTQKSPIGFIGAKKRTDAGMIDAYEAHIGGSITENGHYFALSNPDWWVAADKIDQYVVKIVDEFIGEYDKNNSLTIENYMISQREVFDFDKYKEFQ